MFYWVIRISLSFLPDDSLSVNWYFDWFCENSITGAGSQLSGLNDVLNDWKLDCILNSMLNIKESKNHIMSCPLWEESIADLRTSLEKSHWCESCSLPGINMHNFLHYDVIKWKHFPRYWPFVWGIHRSRWIPHTKASDAELWCFLWSAPE